ncbi:DUF6896 domain-containing protein [Streptomyces cyaneofuscatus]|uniref:DUF6896 domain-containing protein n=1 Tax=Streptomyces cyaneofuscatus TaxID=66883 RepID=UPI0037B35195
MERVGDARELVLGYLHALNAIDEAMRVAIPSLERLGDVLGLARSCRIISRSGHVGTYSCTVHGAGCRFVSDDGTEVDVDFAADGSEVFDLWRQNQRRQQGRRGLPEALHVRQRNAGARVRKRDAS